MLLILVTWIYIALISFVLGGGLIRINMVILKIESPQTLSFPIISLIGLGYLSVICNSLFIWIPINLTTHLIILGIFTILLVINFNYLWFHLFSYFKQFRWFSWLLLVIFFIFLIIQSVPISSGTDESGYYIQTLLWMEKYPIIPGLGNLSVCYTYNSSWHIICSFFRFPFLGLHNLFNDLNGYLYGIIFIYVLPSLQNLMKGKASYVDLTKVFIIIIGYFTLRGSVVTINVDSAILFFTWLILTLWLDSLFKEKSELTIVYLIHLSLFSFTIKLSAIILILIPIYFGIYAIFQFQFRKVIYIFIITLLFCIPYFTKNVLSSGYLLSPMTIIDIFDVDWKVPKPTNRGGLIGFDYLFEPYLTGITHHREVLKNDGEEVIYGERLTIIEFLWDFLSANNFYGYISMTLLFVVSLIHLVYIFTPLNKLKIFFQKNDFRFITLITYSGLCFFVFLLPSWKSGGFRIAAGFLFFYITSTIPLLFFLLKESYRKYTLPLLFGLISFLIVKNLYNVEDKALLFRHYIILPPQYPDVITKTVRIGTIDFYVVSDEGKHCWGNNIPCISEYPVWILPRGKHIYSGFKWNPVYKNRYGTKVKNQQ